jgi:hypothetical protein
LGKGDLAASLEMCSQVQIQLAKLMLMDLQGEDVGGLDSEYLERIVETFDRLSTVLQDRIESGETGEEAGKQVLERFGGLELDTESCLSWKATAERIGMERDQLEEELQRSEEEVLEQYDS